MPQIPEPYNTSGFSTVGNGTSRGNFNLNNYRSVSACIMDALSQSAGVILLAGEWPLDQVITMPGRGRTLALGPGAVVKNVTSGSVGLISVTGQRNRLIGLGGYIDASTWVNSQSLISVASGGDMFEMKDVFVDVTTTGGNTSTPMNVVSAASVFECKITGFRLAPNVGIRGIRASLVSGLTIDDATIRTMTSAMTSPRSCYEAIRLTGCKWALARALRILGLGTLTTDEMNEVIVVEGDPDTTAGNGDFAALTLTDFTIEQCVSPKLISLLGAVGFTICDGRLANPKGAIAASGEAAVFIDSEDGSSTVGDESKICGVGTIENVIFESCATSSGNGIYLKNAKKVDLNEIHFHIPTSAPTAFIKHNIDQVRSVGYGKIRFDGDSTNSLYGIQWESAGTPLPVDISIDGPVKHSGLVYGIAAPMEPLGVWSASSTYNDGSLAFGHNLSIGTGLATPRQLIDSSALGVSGITGGTITIPATTTFSGTASGSANYACAVLAAKINRLWCGFGVWQSNLTDNSGGVAVDGTVADVTDTTTFNDAVKELATKLNEIINLPESSAGKIKFYKTMVNGSHTAGAVQKLLDDSANPLNSTGNDGTKFNGIYSAVGTLASITNASTAANALATLIFFTNTICDYFTLTKHNGVMTLAGL